MKKYCLKPKAKKEIASFIYKLSLPIMIFIFSFGFFAFIMGLLGADDGITNTFKYIGILSWTAVFSFIAIGIKRWLQSNIMEC